MESRTMEEIQRLQADNLTDDEYEDISHISGSGSINHRDGRPSNIPSSGNGAVNRNSVQRQGLRVPINAPRTAQRSQGQHSQTSASRASQNPSQVGSTNYSNF